MSSREQKAKENRNVEFAKRAVKKKASAPTIELPRAINLSGIRPIEFNVLVKQKKVEEKIGSIILAEQTREREQAAAIEGEIVAISPLAFTYEDWGAEEKPKIGQWCIFAKYAGMKVKGRDGEEYLLVKDKDLAAVFE